MLGIVLDHQILLIMHRSSSDLCACYRELHVAFGSKQSRSSDTFAIRIYHHYLS